MVRQTVKVTVIRCALIIISAIGVNTLSQAKCTDMSDSTSSPMRSRVLTPFPGAYKLMESQKTLRLLSRRHSWTLSLCLHCLMPIYLPATMFDWQGVEWGNCSLPTSSNGSLLHRHPVHWEFPSFTFTWTTAHFCLNGLQVWVKRIGYYH